MPHSYSEKEPKRMIASDQKENHGEDETPETITHDALQSLIAAQERELSKIARELHDDICQRLAMLSLKIEKAAKAWATGQKQVGEQLEQIWLQCSVLTGDVQALSHDLHPSILNNLGLVTAVRSFCRELSEESGAVVDFVNTNVPDSIPPEIALSLFRLVQEALHNSLKYSGDNRVRVCLQGDPSGIQLEVRDQGVGFDVAHAKNNHGLGLVSMRERIQLLNGTIDIDSKPAGGTRIHVWVPLASDSATLFGPAN
jgi:signal transduction histidine kinase